MTVHLTAVSKIARLSGPDERSDIRGWPIPAYRSAHAGCLLSRILFACCWRTVKCNLVHRHRRSLFSARSNERIVASKWVYPYLHNDRKQKKYDRPPKQDLQHHKLLPYEVYDTAVLIEGVYCLKNRIWNVTSMAYEVIMKNQQNNEAQDS
jgi:hypothetical protein